MQRLPFITLAIFAAGLAACGETQTGDMTQTASGSETQAPAEADAMMRHDDAVIPFTQAAFEAAQRDNRPILIDVYADWCPVCAQQQPAIETAISDPANSGLVVFQIDFDEQKDEQEQFRVTGQSTLIAFRGTQETGRLMGETDGQVIADLIATTRS